MGFRIEGLGFRALWLVSLATAFAPRRAATSEHSPVPGFRVQSSECRVQGSRFRVQGSGFRVQGSWFRAQGSATSEHSPVPAQCFGVGVLSLVFRIMAF